MRTSGSTDSRDVPRRLTLGLAAALVLLLPAGSTAGGLGDPLYLTLFSTARHRDLAAVDIVLPDGRPLGSLHLDRYRVIERAGKPDKRVFMGELEVPEGARDGWFEAHIRLRDGSEQTARDYLIHQLMPRADGLQPAPGAEDVPLPEQLSWQPVPGAMYYQVFIRDLWQDGKTICES